MRRLIPKHQNSKGKLLSLEELKKQASNPDFALNTSTQSAIKETNNSKNDNVGRTVSKTKLVKSELEYAHAKADSVNSDPNNDPDAEKNKHHGDTMDYRNGYKKTYTNAKVVLDLNGNPKVEEYPVEAGWARYDNPDPIALFYVEGVALSPLFKGIGRAAEYGLARAGNQWARSRIIGREMLNQSSKGLESVIPEAEAVPLQEGLAYRTWEKPSTGSPVSSTLGKTSLKFFERPKSNISEAERVGTPKVERNNAYLDDYANLDKFDPSTNSTPRRRLLVVDKDGTHKLHIDSKHPAFDERLDPGLYYILDGVKYKRGRSNLYFNISGREGEDATSRILATPKVQPIKRLSYLPWELHAVLSKRPRTDLVDFSPTLSKYAETLPEVDVNNTMFRDSDWFNYFKLFYRNKGYDVSKVKPVDMLKVIEENYRQLNGGSTGALKGRVFWSGNPDKYMMNSEGVPVLAKEGVPELFEHSKAGLLTSRTSYSDNSGIYFGRNPIILYSYPTVRFSKNDRSILNGITDLPTRVGRADMLPYMINDVSTVFEQLPPGLKCRIPKGSAVHPNNFKGNMADEYIGGSGDEIAVGIGTPMKSLFPHPEAFTTNEDGTVSLIRNWSDSRLHYKQGGKI